MLSNSLRVFALEHSHIPGTRNRITKSKGGQLTKRSTWFTALSSNVLGSFKNHLLNVTLVYIVVVGH